MIEQKQTNALVLQDGDIQESIEMSLDLESVDSLMQILSKNLYSDAIGSTVRETASNALDSHRAAGVTDRPIIVSLKSNGSAYEFTVEDFGTGLDHDDVVKIISKYGKSTSRNFADRLGMMGLGFKAPLAYVSSFTFVARKNGMERKYMMYEGEERNTIDLLDESPTTAPNGVKVTIPVEYHDKNEFYEKIKEQLCYFENVYFDVTTNSGTIDNDFKITRYEDFQLSELAGDDELHLSLDDVYYPIDFKKLDIPVIKVPVALRFGLSDGIFPIPNREAIRYSREAKEIIKKKMAKVATKMVEMYNSTIVDTDNIKEIVKYYQGSDRCIDVGHKKNIKINDLIKYSIVPVREPKLNGISLIELKSLFSDRNEILREYEVKYHLYNGRMRKGSSRWRDELNISYALERPVYKFSDILGGKMKDYIRSIAPRDSFFIKKTKLRPLFVTKEDKAPTWGYNPSPRSYESLLHLKAHPKSEWRQRVKECQDVLARIEALFTDISTIQIPQAWIDARKKTSSVKRTKGHTRLEGEIACKKAMDLERYVGGKDSKMVPFSLDLGKVYKTNVFYVYTNHENAAVLDKLFEIGKPRKIRFITFSEREIKKINEAEVHNLIHYDRFMEGKTKPFKRIVTSYLIHGLVNEYPAIFKRTREEWNDISTDVCNKLCKLYDYEDTHYTSSGNREMYEAMLAVAEKHSLYDQPIYTTYLEIKGFLEKFPFLETLCRELNFRDPERDVSIGIIVDMLKYHKFKVNLDKYKLPIKEEVTT